MVIDGVAKKPVVEALEILWAALPEGAELLLLVGAVDAVPDHVAGDAVRHAHGAPVREERAAAGKVLRILGDHP